MDFNGQRESKGREQFEGNYFFFAIPNCKFEITKMFLKLEKNIYISEYFLVL